MARTNKCKECGWDGTDPIKDTRGGIVQQWVGTNHNLCSVCVHLKERAKALAWQQSAESRRAELKEKLEAAPTYSARRVALLAAMAAGISGGKR